MVNQTWTLSGSPYCIQADITAVGLTIEPGVCVRADSGVQINIGLITAIGTIDQPIVFTAADPVSRWGGIVFNNTAGGSNLTHCRVELSDNRGLRIQDSTPTISHCTITNNTAVANGGGIWASLSAGQVLTLDDCAIINNTVNETLSSGSFRGGGLYVSGGNHVLRRCTIRSNKVFSRCSSMFCSAFAYGGGVYLENSAVEITGCAIQDNLADCRTSCNGASSSLAFGGGVYVGSGSLLMSNSFVACNTSTASCGIPNSANQSEGSGLHVAGGAVDVVNCTVARNSNHGVRRVGGTLTIKNTIVYFNGGSDVSGSVVASYCNVGGPPLTGTGNINFDPLFLSTQGCDVCDLTVVLGSPCVDAGDPGVSHEDVCFPPSLGGSRNDLGAHGGPLACNWIPTAPQTYCVAKTDSLGCSPQIYYSGSPSLTSPGSFSVRATGVQSRRTGMVVWGLSCATVPFQGATLCVLPPLKRTAPQFSFGNLPPDCTGAFDFDFNALIQSGVSPFLTQGNIIFTQYWYRDSAAPANPTGLSDALMFAIGG